MSTVRMWAGSHFTQGKEGMAMWLAEILTPAGKSSQKFKLFPPSYGMETKLQNPKLG